MKTALVPALLFLLVSRALRAEDSLTPAQVEAMRERGWITPEFEANARQLVEARETMQKAKDDQARLESQLPALQTRAEESNQRTIALKAELARVSHPDETDFEALQQTMKNPAAKPEDQMAAAQAYVWTYPGGAHTAEAQDFLRQVQKKIADQVQAQKDADAAATTAHLKLLARVKAHNLSLGEWRAFLQDKSKAEVQQYLGAPSWQDDEHWVYNGNWTIDPTSNLKSGIQITYNGGRVQNVAPLPPK